MWLTALQINLGDTLIVGNGKPISSFTAYSTIGGLISLIVQNMFLIAGLAFLFLMIWAGVNIITAGESSAKALEEQRGKITTAILGLLLMFISYWVVQIVETLTGLTILG
jgi:hypothetical protein